MKNTCPTLPDCKLDADRCLTHQWYSNTRLSSAVQELLLDLDFHSVSDEDLDLFVAQKANLLLS